MTFEANGNLLDIESELWNDIEAPKLAAFKTSNTPVPLRASPSQNQTTTYTEANQAKQAYRQKEAREKAKSRHKHIILDYDTLKEEVTRHGNYLTAQDHVIVNGMKMREPWKKQMKQICKDLSDLTVLINTNDIACTDIDMSTLGDKVNTVQYLIQTRFASIEEAERKKACSPTEPPSPSHRRCRATLAPPVRTSAPLRTSLRRRPKTTGSRRSTSWKRSEKPLQEMRRPASLQMG